MPPRRMLALPVLFLACACGGSGGGGGGGGGVEPINLTTFQSAGDILGQSLATGGVANDGAGPATPNQSGLNFPFGYVGSGSLFVADDANNRVMGWNSIPTGLGQPADFVIGQTGFTAASAGTTASTLQNPCSCWVASGALFVADASNSRVLIYSPVPTSSTPAAAAALGKPDLTSGTATGGQGGLNQPNGVCVAANRVVVADTGNHRVMIWNGIPALSGANAQVVVGQSDFLVVTAGSGAAKMNQPLGAWTDGTRLAVADTSNHRVLIWTTFPTSNGQLPDIVVGQPDFVTNTSGTGAQKMNNPSYVASDGVNLFVAEQGNNRVLVFSPFPTASNPAATAVLGQNSFTNVAANDDDQNGVADATPTARTLNAPQGVTVVGPRLYVADTANHRVLVFRGS